MPLFNRITAEFVCLQEVNGDKQTVGNLQTLNAGRPQH